MIYDIKTRNRSFLETAMKLKEKGVKNNKFMLTLYDESLVGVDPHSDNLTPAQQAAIYVEICKNKWYYLREVVRIPTTGSGGIPYAMNIGNCAQSYASSRNLNFISILPRQQGKTIGEICDDTWVMLFGSRNCQMIYLNKQYPDAVENGRRFKNIKGLLPKWILSILTSKEDKDNQDQKLIGKLGNQILIKPAATSDESADKLGRGLTCAILYIDEYAFLNKNQIIYDACFPAWKTAAENAAKNNVPYGIHITTTPNNIDTDSGNHCYNFIQDACPFNYKFYDMTEEEIKKVLDGYNKPFVFIQYTWQEIGRTEKWYKDMQKGMSNYLKFKREVDLKWTKSRDDSIFTESQLERIEKFTKQPLYTMFIENRMINFYETPDIRKRYILSCDVSGGLEQDNSVITFISPDDFRVVGDFSNSKIDTDSFEDLIKKLIKNYFVNSLLVIERNSYGKNILDALMKDPKIEPRLYRDKREKTAEKTTERGINVKTKREMIVYGVNTDVESRKKMFDLLPHIVNEEYESIVSPLLARDIANLVELPNGKIAAGKGCHDDSLMSYLIFRYAVHDGGPFFQTFGIDKIPSSSGAEKETTTTSALRISRQLLNMQKRDNVSHGIPVHNLATEDINASDYLKNAKERPRSTMYDNFAKWNK